MKLMKMKKWIKVFLLSLFLFLPVGSAVAQAKVYKIFKPVIVEEQERQEELSKDTAKSKKDKKKQKKKTKKKIVKKKVQLKK